MSELIEKQKVLDALREIATEKFSLDDPYGVYINVLIDVEEKICSLPVVQPNGPDNLVKDSQVLAKDLANDCISRRAAIDAVKDRYYKYDRFAKVEELVWEIEGLPSAQPYTDEEIQKMQDIEQAQLDKAYEMGKADALRWIPCSEGLPDAECGESDIVLATCGYMNVKDTSVRWIKTLYFNGGNWCYPTGETYEQKVYAWMPLPEPYRRANDG